jgi:hypothetical protein
MSAESTWVELSRKALSLSALFAGFVDHLDIPVTGFIEETLLAAPIYVLFLSARLYSSMDASGMVTAVRMG